MSLANLMALSKGNESWNKKSYKLIKPNSFEVAEVFNFNNRADCECTLVKALEMR